MGILCVGCYNKFVYLSISFVILIWGGCVIIVFLTVIEHEIRGKIASKKENNHCHFFHVQK